MGGRRLGSVLVGLQFGLIAVLVGVALPVLVGERVPALAWGLAIAGAALGVWALASHPPGNFNIHPEPRAGGHLVQRGPYRWIRHPMYTAVIVFGLACAWTAGGGASRSALVVVLGWASLVALVAVLRLKAGLEERWLLAAHPGYADYRARSWRFVPGVW